MADASQSVSVSSTLLDQLRLRRGDAWQRFVKLYSPLIYRWSRQAGLAADDAADVLQEVLVAVMLHLADFRREKPQDTFTGWLAAITRNKVRDHFRRQCGKAEARGGSTAQRQLAEVADEAPESVIRPDADSAAWLSRRVLETIQAEFEPRTWAAFWRTAIDAQPSAGVAQDLGMTIPAVYMAKSRVLRRLRQAMGELPQ